MATREIPILGPAKLIVSWEAREAIASMEAIEARLRQPRTLWGRVGRTMRQSFAQSFAEGGRPKWAPLAVRTVKAKAAFLAAKPSPPFTKAGKAPRRLLQLGTLSGHSVLIQTGELRDSWVQLGAKGHVEQVGASGRTFFIGSQLERDRPTTPTAAKSSLKVKKKSPKAKGKSASGRIPLAIFHEQGTSKMPARPVAVVQKRDLAAVEMEAARWVTGETGGE